MAPINETNRINKNCQAYESSNYYKQLRWKINWTSLDSINVHQFILVITHEQGTTRLELCPQMLAHLLLLVT